MRFAHIIALPLLFFTENQACAEVTTDDRLWISAAIRGELVEDLAAEFTQQVRLPVAGEYNQQVIPGLGLAYKLLPQVSLGSGARYRFEEDEGNETTRDFRIHGDVGLDSPELGPAELGYRLRYQSESSALMESSKNRLRNRLSLKISTGTAVRPGVFYEHFLDPQGGATKKAQKHRIGGDVSLKIKKNHRLKMRYFQDTEIDGDGDRVRVAALGYRYSL